MWNFQGKKKHPTSSFPPPGEKDKEILARVKKGEVKFDPADWSDVSSDAIDFIKSTGSEDWWSFWFGNKPGWWLDNPMVFARD